jgi:hypothetical protein
LNRFSKYVSVRVYRRKYVFCAPLGQLTLLFILL